MSPRETSRPDRWAPRAAGGSRASAGSRSRPREDREPRRDRDRDRDRLARRPAARGAGRRPDPQRFDPTDGRFDVGPGRPWPVVLVGVVLASAVLAWIGVYRSGLIGLLFPIGFVVVSVVGVCAVRRDQVLPPAVAPPVTALLAILLTAAVTGRTTSTTTFLLAVVPPFAELFWWIALALAAAVFVAVARTRNGRSMSSVLSRSAR